MISGRDIVFISSIEWDFLWQVHQEIAFRFAEAGNRIFYLENTGIRRPQLADAKRVQLRLYGWARSSLSRKVREVAPNIFALSPLVMPPFGSAAEAALNRRLLLPVVRKAVRKLNFRDPILWTYLPTDTALTLIDLLKTPSTVTAYYCGADFRVLSTKPLQCAKSENELFKTADLVFATCDELEDRARQFSNDVHRIPALVDLQAFPLANVNGSAARSSYRATIGYVGGLHRHFDLQLVIKMVQTRRDWLWVFVGGATVEVDELSQQPNVRILGQRPHRELAHHLTDFDVCIVPYATSDHTATVVPMKINEYLAIGKPVVSTALPAVCDFNEQHHILWIAPNDAEAFVGQIELALAAPNGVDALQRRRQVAALGDSRVAVQRISSLIESKIREKPSPRE